MCVQCIMGTYLITSYQTSLYLDISPLNNTSGDDHLMLRHLSVELFSPSIQLKLKSQILTSPSADTNK